MKSWVTNLAVAVLVGFGAISFAQAAEQPTGREPHAAVQAAIAEAKQRKDWNTSMSQKAPPARGCFTAAYPRTEWQATTCTAPPNIPMLPRIAPRPFVVGNGNDIAQKSRHPAE